MSFSGCSQSGSKFLSGRTVRVDEIHREFLYKFSVCFGAVLVDTSLQNFEDIRDSDSGLPDRDGGVSF